MIGPGFNKPEAVKLKALNQELPIWRKKGEPGEGTERDNGPHRLNRLQRLSVAVQVLPQTNVHQECELWTNRSNHSDVFIIKTGAADLEENGAERRRAETSEKPYRRRGADKIGPKM